MKKKTRGDVFRINITPPADTFPWVRIFLHPYGIRKAGKEVGGAGGLHIPEKEMAQKIGEQIIRYSKVLPAWFKEQRKR